MATSHGPRDDTVDYSVASGSDIQILMIIFSIELLAMRSQQRSVGDRQSNG